MQLDTIPTYPDTVRQYPLRRETSGHNLSTRTVTVSSQAPRGKSITIGRDECTKKQRKAYQKAVEELAFRMDLTPIGEMDFSDYNVLSKRPPKGNISLTHRVLLDLLQVAKNLTEVRPVVALLEFEHSSKVMGRFELMRNGIIPPKENHYPAFEMTLQVLVDGRMVEPRTPAVYESLVDNLSEKHLWSRGCPRDFDVTDFMVARGHHPSDKDRPIWVPVFPGDFVFDEAAVKLIPTW